MRDRIEYDPQLPRWFVYAVHWWNKRLFCNRRRGHTLTRYRSCDVCGEYVRQ